MNGRLFLFFLMKRKIDPFGGKIVILEMKA